MSQRLQYREEEQSLQGLPPVRRQVEEDKTHRPLVREESTHTPGHRLDENTRQWWQEDINGLRGVPKTAALAVGLLPTLNVFMAPLYTIIAHTVMRFATSNVQGRYDPAAMSAAASWSLAFSILPALLAGYILTRIAPRNAVAGAMFAGAVQLLLAILHLIIYYITFAPNTFLASRPYLDFLLRPLLTGVVLVLTTVALAYHTRFKQERER